MTTDNLDQMTLQPDFQALTTHLATLGLSPRLARSITIASGEVGIAKIVPVVQLAPDQGAGQLHRQEGGIAISQQGVMVGCVATIDERTAIASLQFFHVVNNSVVEGPTLSPSDLVGKPWYTNIAASTSAGQDPGTLAVHALQSLSTDSESRAAHPNLDFTALFSADNLSFISSAAQSIYLLGLPGTEPADLVRNTGILPAIDISKLCACTCTCTTGCTCSTCATSTIVVGRTHSNYLASLTELHRELAAFVIKSWQAVG